MEHDLYAAFSPLDHRYYLANRELFDALAEYLSENGLIKAQLRVEAAVTKGLAKWKICPAAVAAEVEQACREVDPSEVYQEEAKTRHNIRALVNCIQRRVSPEARPFVHFSVTSMDIVDTANALRFMEATNKVLLPLCLEFLDTLITLARREKATLQMGRTHGQHAVPVTFGFAVAEYVSRFGQRLEKIKAAADNLRGKIAGAVGAYNALALFLPDPEVFAEEVLAELGLKPSPSATQIVEPEFFADYFHALISTFGVLANLADDFRNLQRTELAEIGEEFAPEQVGSSTMPHKRNPWNFEHVKSMWKAFVPRMFTVYLDQISEHQRDLTNSASSRFNPEIVVALAAAVARLNKVLKRLVVHEEQMRKNFMLTQESVIAEPLYILLAYYGHPDAHEAVRKLTLRAEAKGITLRQLLNEKEEVAELTVYLDKFSPAQWAVLNHPEQYLGIAVRKTELICAEGERILKSLGGPAPAAQG